MKLAMVAGNMIIEEAKIGGITPAVFHFQGKVRRLSTIHFLPTIRFAYCTGIRLWPLSTKTITGHHPQHQDDENQNKKDAHLTGRHQAEGIQNSGRALYRQCRQK